MPKFFRISIVLILAVAGGAKVWSAFGSAKLLVIQDPLLDLKFGHLMFIIGALELSVASILLLSKLRAMPTVLVAWLASSVLAYRLGLWLIGWRRPCSCLGNLTDAIHISPQLADNVMKGLLAYLLIVSYATLFWLWLQRRKAEGRLKKENTIERSEMGVGS